MNFKFLAFVSALAVLTVFSFAAMMRPIDLDGPVFLDPEQEESGIEWESVKTYTGNFSDWQTFTGIPPFGMVSFSRDATGFVFAADAQSENKFGFASATYSCPAPECPAGAGECSIYWTCPFSSGDFVKVSFTLQPLSDVQQLPSLRLRVNRSDYKTAESLIIIPRKVSNGNWAVNEGKTFSIILNTEDYPIDRQNGIIISLDVLALEQFRGNGSIKLTKVEVSRAENVYAVENLYNYDFGSQSHGWTMAQSVPPLIPVSIMQESNGVKMVTNSEYTASETSGQNNVQFGMMQGPMMNNMNVEGNIYSLNARFDKQLPANCSKGPALRMRLNSEDFAYGHEKYYFLTAEHPLNYPSQGGSFPLRVWFNPTDAASLTQNANFTPSIDLVNYDPQACVGSGVKIFSSNVNRANGVTQTGYTCANYANGSSRVRGDLTEDGRVTFLDVALMNQMVLGNRAKPINLCCVDLDSDASLTSADVTLANDMRLGRNSSAGTCASPLVPVRIGSANDDENPEAPNYAN